MKKIIILTISAILINVVLIGLSSLYSAQITYANGLVVCTSSAQCDTGEMCVPVPPPNSQNQKVCQSLMPEPAGTGLGVKDSSELSAVKNLPKVTSEQVFKTAIKTVLGAAMLLTIIGIVVAGIYYLQSQGNEEDTTKAKNIILYLLIGLVVMASAYGIVTGVAQFEFFEAAQ